MEATQQETGAAPGERRHTERLFQRDLPGGGYVMIEVATEGLERRRARISVERRADRRRRVGHKPPVIHEEEWSQDRIGDLYRLAIDNVAIARILLALQRRSDRAD